MSPLGKKTSHSADEWLLNGSERNGSHGPAANGDETAQWLVDSDDARPAAETPTPVPPQPAAAPVPAENGEVANRVRDLQTELRAQEREAQERLAQTTADLVKKHDSREQRLTTAFEKQRSELTKGFETREAELRGRIEKLESELAAAEAAAEEERKNAAAATREKGSSRKTAKTRRGKRDSDKLDLNQATFEELRGLGLSVTQSARVIAYRDVRGGFESLDELAEIPGIPKETRSGLGERLSLSS